MVTTQRDRGHYVPILKGRQGELDALANIGEERQWMTPLLEVVPSGMDDFDPAQAEQDLRRFSDRLESRWTTGLPVIVDVGLFPSDSPLSGGRFPIQYMADEVESRGLYMVPTARPSDLRVSRDATRSVIQAHEGAGVCIRLGAQDLDDDDTPLEDSLSQLLDDLGAEPERTDLILDFGALPDEAGLPLAVRMARYLLGDVPMVSRWRSFTLASGGFPTGLSTVAAEVFGDIPRIDWRFWLDVSARSATRIERLPGFGDYGIAHPAIAQGAAFAPAPQIRYTADDAWIVLRGRKGVRRGSAQFYDICARLVARPEYSGPDFSWGDKRILSAAQSSPEGSEPMVGPGNASTWRSIGTSHHLAFVVNRLATQPGP